jgi:hypothetical protein
MLTKQYDRPFYHQNDYHTPRRQRPATRKLRHLLPVGRRVMSYRNYGGYDQTEPPVDLWRTPFLCLQSLLNPQKLRLTIPILLFHRIRFICRIFGSESDKPHISHDP